jgi:hypothetical protein
MNPVPKGGNTSEEAMQEFLDKGGKIQKFEYGQRTENLEYKTSFYGKRPKQKEQKEEDDE